MKRRTFLQSSSIALAGAAATAIVRPSRPAQAGELSGRLKKAVGLGMVREKLSIEDKLRLLKDVGFDGVEVRTLPRRSGPDPKALARASEKVGLPVHGVVNGNRPDLQAAIDEAALYGATSVLVVVPENPAASYLDNYRQTQETIRRAIPHAEHKHVFILIENVWATFLIEPLTMARYIDELNSPYVKAYFDIGNVVRWGWPQHWIEVLGKRIVRLHAKEYDLKVAMNQGLRKGFGSPLGSGSIDWGQVRKQLVAIDYHGWVTAEVGGGDRARLAEIGRQMDQVLDL